MTADVKEYPQLPVRTAGDQQGRAAKVKREDRAGLGELVDVTKAQRQLSKQLIALGLKAPYVIVDLRIERGSRYLPIRTGRLVELSGETLEQMLPG
jgi:hypothetical protein